MQRGRDLPSVGKGWVGALWWEPTGVGVGGGAARCFWRGSRFLVVTVVARHACGRRQGAMGTARSIPLAIPVV